jgi:hypothetical protein
MAKRKAESQSVNLTFEHVYRCHATYRWNALNEGYNFVFNLTSIRGIEKKLWPSNMLKVPILEISGFPSS